MLWIGSHAFVRFVRSVDMQDGGAVMLGDPVRTNLDTVRWFPYPFMWEDEQYLLNGMDVDGGVTGIYKCGCFPNQVPYVWPAILVL